MRNRERGEKLVVGRIVVVPQKSDPFGLTACRCAHVSEA